MEEPDSEDSQRDDAEHDIDGDAHDPPFPPLVLLGLHCLQQTRMTASQFFCDCLSECSEYHPSVHGGQRSFTHRTPSDLLEPFPCFFVLSALAVDWAQNTNKQKQKFVLCVSSF